MTPEVSHAVGEQRTHWESNLRPETETGFGTGGYVFLISALIPGATWMPYGFFLFVFSRYVIEHLSLDLIYHRQHTKRMFEYQVSVGLVLVV